MITLAQVVLFYWISILLAYITRFLHPSVYSFTSFGKVDSWNGTLVFSVSCKTNYLMAYLTGVILNLWLMQYHSTWIMILFQIHLFRRLWETLFVTKFSTVKQIRLPLFVFAITFYIFVPLTLFQQSDHLQGLSIFLFLFGNLVQYQSHVILAQLRHHQEYSIPHGAWFEYSTNPHYFAEILIYLSFYLSSDGFSFLPCLLFVIINLVSSSIDSYDWYVEKFKEFPRDRNILIPGLF
jgi:hypothetical protein